MNDEERDSVNRSDIKTMVRGAYDLQKLRIQIGNRVTMNFKAKLGIEAGEKEEKAEENVKYVLREVRERFKRLTDGIIKGRLPPAKSFVGDPVISSYTDLCLVAQYLDIEEMETEHFRRLASVLNEYPIYTKFLKDVRGIGPAIAGVIISEIDISKDKYVSSIWKYAGLDVVIEDNRGRGRYKEHLRKITYINSKGEEAERYSITFNPFLKTKLIGVLGTSFLRSASPYADVYRNYKHRLEVDPSKKDWTKKHRHNAAVRYMIKMFLIDLYTNWRELEGLPVAPPYHEAKLGLKHQEVLRSATG